MPSKECQATPANTELSRAAVLDWIAAIARQRLGLPDDAVAPSSAFDHDQWDMLARLLRANRFWSLASPRAFRGAPIALQRQASIAAARARLHNLRVMATIGRVAPVFERAGIEALVIKGPLQQERCFGTPFERAATDADFWIRFQDREAAIRALRDAGYCEQAECRSPWWRLFLGEAHFAPPSRGLSEVDLHHRLGQAGLPLPRHPERFFAEAVAGGSLASTARLPAEHHAFLIVCLALVRGVMARETVGHHALEVAVVWNGRDQHFAETVGQTAREQGMKRLTGLALALAGQALSLDLAGDDFPQPRLERHRARQVVFAGRDGWTRRRLTWLVCDGPPAIRLARFLRIYAAHVTGQVVRKLLHRPGESRQRPDQSTGLQGEPPDSLANPNPA